MLLAVVMLCVGVAADQSATVGDVSVEVSGRSGTIKITAEKYDKTITVEWIEIKVLHILKPHYENNY